MTAFIQKIAFVLPNFEAGGAERVMITVANNLDRSRFKPCIVVFNSAGPLRNLVAADVEVIPLDAGCLASGFIPFVRLMRARRPHLIVSTMAHLNMSVLLARFFLPGVSVAVREAVTPSYFRHNPLKRLVLALAYHALYPFADRILAPTRLVFDEMPATLKSHPEKLRRVFNPVDTALIKSGVDASFRGSLAAPGQKLFVGAGRLVDQKGFDRLIRTLQSWRDRDDWRLFILGEGPDHDKLKSMIKKEGLHQITLTGFEARPWRYFAVADAFLLPSRHEGLPNVALEALALGSPVIAAASAGGIAEIAAEAAPASVRIAETMDEFLALMIQVEPSGVPAPRESLLPDCFSLAAVVASYEQIFTELHPAKRRED